MDSIFRWAGSKRRLIPTLVDLAPRTFDRYIEPFAGSACLFFRLEPAQAVLSDINKELINALKQVRKVPQAVAKWINSLPITKESYYLLRSVDLTLLSPLQRAARFIYLNRFCFNGIYRTNNEGRFNVPYGGAKSGALPTVAQLENCSLILKRASVRCLDFEEALSAAQCGDFVYIDPPYSVKSRRIFKQYDGATFGDHDIRRLKLQLNRLDAIGAKFLISYAESAEGRSLAAGYRMQKSYVQRSVAGFVGNRRCAKEILITNY